MFQIYTVSRDGAIFTWKEKGSEDDDSDAEPPIASTSSDPNYVANTRWGVHERHYFNQPGTKVVCVSFHPVTSLLIVGFSTGVFGLWEMPAFTNIQTLSVSQEKISSVAINATGEWLAFGAKKLGQLLVWECPMCARLQYGKCFSAASRNFGCHRPNTMRGASKVSHCS